MAVEPSPEPLKKREGQSHETRAIQHLLIQGFTLYTCTAAVCTRLVSRAVLDDPAHSWVVICGPNSLQWTAMLQEDDPLRSHLAEAAVRSADPKTPHVVCHTAGSTLLVPLTVADVHDARLRIEAAVILGKSPPAEKLEAFPDELIEREAKKRGLLKSKVEPQ